MDIHEKEMTPDRKLKVRFNQVSDDSPFKEAAAYQDTSSEEEVFDKVGNITPGNRAEMGDGQNRPWAKLVSGITRVSDPEQIKEKFREIEAEERRRLDNSSPYRHMTTFQQTLQARDNLAYQQGEFKRSRSTLDNHGSPPRYRSEAGKRLRAGRQVNSAVRRGRNIQQAQVIQESPRTRERAETSLQRRQNAAKNMTQTVNVIGGDEPQSLDSSKRMNRNSYVEQFKDEAAGKTSGWFAASKQALAHSATMRDSVPEYFKQPLALQDKQYGKIRTKSIEKQNQNERFQTESQEFQVAPPSFRYQQAGRHSALEQFTESQRLQPYYGSAQVTSTEQTVEWPSALQGQYQEPVIQDMDTTEEMAYQLRHSQPLPSQHNHVIKSARELSQQHIFEATPIYGRVSQAVLRDYTYGRTADLEAKYHVSDKVAQLPGYDDTPKVSFNMAQYLPSERNQKFVNFVRRVEVAYRKQQVSEFAMALISAAENMRTRRQVLLNGYITYCAMIIQRLFRGHMDRKYYGPFYIKLGGMKAGRAKFAALCAGWRVRAIMRLREVRKRAQNIRDHDAELRQPKTQAEYTDLRRSRRNTVLNFLHLLKTLLRDGQWTLRVERVMRRGTYQVPTSKEEEARMLRKIQTQKSLPNMSKMGYDRRQTVSKPIMRRRSPVETLAKRVQIAHSPKPLKTQIHERIVQASRPAPAAELQAPVKRSFVSTKLWNRSPARDDRETELLNFKRRMSYQPNVRKRVTTHEVLGYQNHPDEILPHSKQRQAYRVQEYLDKHISEDYKEGGMNVLLPGRVKANEAGYIGHFLDENVTGVQSTPRKPYTPSNRSNALFSKAQVRGLNKTSTFQQAMKISQGLAEAMKKDSSSSNPYVRATPSNYTGTNKRDSIKDKLKYKYSQSSMHTKAAPAGASEAEGSTRGQAEQLKTFMLDQMLSESGKEESKHGSNPYVLPSRISVPSYGKTTSSLERKEVRFQAEPELTEVNLVQSEVSIPVATYSTSQKEGGDKAYATESANLSEAQKQSISTMHVVRPSGGLFSKPLPTSVITTHITQTQEEPKPIVSSQEMAQMMLPEVPSPESNFLLHPEKVDSPTMSPLTPVKPVSLTDIESPMSSAMIKPQKIEHFSPDLATRNDSPFSLRQGQREYTQINTISEIQETQSPYQYKTFAVTTEGPEQTDPMPEKVDMAQPKFAALPQMAGLSPVLGSPVSYTLLPEEVQQTGSEIKVYDRKMTDDNVFRNAPYFASDLKSQSEAGFRIQPHHVKSRSRDGMSPETAFGSAYLKPANVATTEKNTPPQSLDKPISAIGTSPLHNIDMMTDVRSMNSKASFALHPRKVDHDFTPSPLTAKMPDEDAIMSAIRKQDDDVGFSLGLRAKPIQEDINVAVEMRTDDFSSLRNVPNITIENQTQSMAVAEPATAEFAIRAQSTLEKRLDSKTLHSGSGSKTVGRKESSSGSQGAYSNQYIWNTIGRKASKLTTSDPRSSKLTTVSTSQINVTPYTGQIAKGKDELLTRPPTISRSLNDELWDMELPACYVGPDGVIIDETALVIKNNSATAQQVDAIVNPTDNRLFRASDNISLIGGQKMARESKAWLEKYGEVPTGGAAYTGASQRPNQYIVHAVWPGSTMGSPRSVERLAHSAVINMLEMAAFLGCTSISVPISSNMVAGMTLKRFIQIIIETSIKWASRHRGTLKQIWFCSVETRIITLLLSHLKLLKTQLGTMEAPALTTKLTKSKSMPKTKFKKATKHLANYMSMTEGFANKALRPDHVSTKKPMITANGVRPQTTNVSRVSTITELERVNSKKMLHQLRDQREDPSFERYINTKPQKPQKTLKRASRKVSYQ